MRNKLLLSLLTILGVISGSLLGAKPVSADNLSHSVQGGGTGVVINIFGRGTNGVLSVPVQDGATTSSTITAKCHYGKAYAVRWTLKKGSTSLNTRSQILSESTLQPSGTDSWELNLASLGGGYGEYELTCTVDGRERDTNVSYFKYLPVMATQTGNNKNNPVLTLSRPANVTKVRYTLSKPGRSDLVIVSTSSSDIYTLPMSSYDLPTGTYTLTIEGGTASAWLGNTFTTTINYTKPQGSGIPSMDSERDSGAIAATAAGVVIMGAAKSRRKRNRN